MLNVCFLSAIITYWLIRSIPDRFSIRQNISSTERYIQNYFENLYELIESLYLENKNSFIFLTRNNVENIFIHVR